MRTPFPSPISQVQRRSLHPTDRRRRWVDLRPSALDPPPYSYAIPALQRPGAVRLLIRPDMNSQVIGDHIRDLRSIDPRQRRTALEAHPRSVPGRLRPGSSPRAYRVARPMRPCSTSSPCQDRVRSGRLRAPDPMPLSAAGRADNGPSRKGFRFITRIPPSVKAHSLLPHRHPPGYHGIFLARMGKRIENPRTQRNRTLRDRRRRHDLGPVVS